MAFSLAVLLALGFSSGFDAAPSTRYQASRISNFIVFTFAVSSVKQIVMIKQTILYSKNR